MSSHSVLALIPAKAASTRLPRKNMATIGGETLVARAVRTALSAAVYASVVVSTEDEEIAEAARQSGANVPFLRPEKLAVDPAGVVDVTLYMLEELEKRGISFKTVAILLPTSPFRTADDCRASLRLFDEMNADFLMSVSRFDHSPATALTLDNGLLQPLLPDLLAASGAASTGQIPKIVRANGAITICNVARMRAERDYYAYPLAAYEMPWQRGLDIDTPEDLELARYFHEHGALDAAN